MCCDKCGCCACNGCDFKAYAAESLNSARVTTTVAVETWPED